jgi:D-sedoheptulose 7-phosphate isomerase
MTKISMKYRDKARKRLLESADVKKKVAQECLESILTVSQMIADTFESGGKVMICGNGGSAADSQHMAGELVCMLNKAFERPGLPAIALSTDTSILTAHANDLGFEKIFKRQVDALGKAGDILIGITTSGSSPNILAAINSAKAAKIRTIMLTGNSKKTKKLADVVLSVPSNNTQYIQESHIAIEHIICEIIEDHLFGAKKVRYGNK